MEDRTKKQLIEEAESLPKKAAELRQERTERRRLKKRLKKSEEWYQQVVESSLLAVYVFQDGRFIYHNPRMRELTGYSEKELDDMNLEQLIHPQDLNELSRYTQQALQGDITGLPIPHQFRVICKDGSVKWAEIIPTLIEVDGRPAILGNAMDITQRKQAEEQLEHSFVDLAETVSRAIESRDPYTAGHQRRVAELARLVGGKMGLDENRLQGLYIGGLFHDIGKISTPASILTKLGELTDEEWNLIRAHAKRGYEILKDTNLPWPVADMALHHHERLNGSGYPHGISGDKLSLENRILGVCDVVEAMSSFRPYRPARSKEEVLEEIKGGRGTKYDASVVDAMLQIIENGGFEFGWGVEALASTKALAL